MCEFVVLAPISSVFVVLIATRSAFVAFTISSLVVWLGSGVKLLMTMAINEVTTVRKRAIYII